MNIKRTITLCMLLTLWVTSTALAANLATVSIQNDSFAEKFKYSIDIYAISTGDAFGVGDTVIALEFNDAVLSNYVLSNQNAVFDNNANYNAMAIILDPGGVGDTNRIALSITRTGGGAGQTLPNTDTRLATITFDIDPTPAVYRTQTTGFVALIGLSSMFSSPATGPVFLTWSDSLDDSLVCTPQIGGSPNTTVAAGNPYSFTPTTVDVCNTIPSVGALAYSVVNDPAWTGFNINTGELSGAPASGDIGTYSNIVITVTDGYGDSADLSAFNIQVTSSGGGGGGGGGGCFISNLLAPW